MFQNTILPCQDQYFVGGQSYNCPYSTTTSESSVDVSKETWVSFWAAGLLDNAEPQQAPQTQEASGNLSVPGLDSCSWEEAQLSSQLYKINSSRILYYRRRKNLLDYMKRIITSDNT